MAQRIDAHIHCGHDDPDLLALMDRYDLGFLNVCVARDHQGDWRDQVETYRPLAAQRPQRFAWCTSFDLPRFQDPTYTDRTLAALEQDLADGAIACKAWKNIGMEVKKPDGSFFHLDDPLLTPIFEALAQAGTTLLTHRAEPRSCWLPLDNPKDPHYSYYSRNPQWHMYGKAEYPSHTQLIQVRDRVAARHPSLRVVGAHLASLEFDVAEVAKRLDRYPNFAVDISARLGDLAYQDSATVARFFDRYRDRILFGTDVVMRRPLADMSPEEKEQALTRLEETFQTHFVYLESRASITVRGIETTGLGLAPAILDRVYRLNAREWYPGLTL